MFFALQISSVFHTDLPTPRGGVTAAEAAGGIMYEFQIPDHRHEPAERPGAFSGLRERCSRGGLPRGSTLVGLGCELKSGPPPCRCSRLTPDGLESAAARAEGSAGRGQASGPTTGR